MAIAPLAPCGSMQGWQVTGEMSTPPERAGGGSKELKLKIGQRRQGGGSRKLRRSHLEKKHVGEGSESEKRVGLGSVVSTRTS